MPWKQFLSVCFVFAVFFAIVLNVPSVYMPVCQCLSISHALTSLCGAHVDLWLPVGQSPEIMTFSNDLLFYQCLNWEATSGVGII